MSRDLTTQYRAFSLTWPASLQIYWNKRKRLHKKDCNSHRIVSELKHGRRFIVLELQYCRDDVMRKTPCLYFKMNKLCVANFDSVQSSMLKLLQFSTFFSCYVFNCYQLEILLTDSWSINHFPRPFDCFLLQVSLQFITLQWC